MASGTKIGEIPNVGGSAIHRSLSTDGKHIAFLDRAGQSIEIWSYETGTRLQTIKVEEGSSRVSGFLLPTADRLITGTQQQVEKFRFRKSLKLFDTSSGTLLKTVPPDEDVPNTDSFTVSDGGRYLARLLSTGQLQLLESATLETAVTIPIPVLENGFSGTSFSPDGTEIACMMSNATETKIVTASLKDGRVTEIGLSENNSGTQPYDGPRIQWLPDQSGWILFGQRIVHRKIARQVWEMRFQGNTTSNRRLVLQKSVLAQSALKPAKNGKHDPPQLLQLDWPKETVETAGLKFGDTRSAASSADVEVVVQVDELRFGEVAETTEKIRSTLDEALRKTGLESPEPRAAMTLHANYSESRGKVLYRRGASPLLIADPKIGGPGVQSTAVLIKLKLMISGNDEPVWMSELKVDPIVLTVEGSSSEADVHDAVMNSVRQRLRGYSLPFFISDQLTLPGIRDNEL
ncbi:MAG: WD40 repeat domain-containing protein [Planctomycetaceae bacterium]